MKLHIEHTSPVSLQLCLADPAYREGRVQANLRSFGELLPRKIDDLPFHFRYVKFKVYFLISTLSLLCTTTILFTSLL